MTMNSSVTRGEGGESPRVTPSRGWHPMKLLLRLNLRRI